jgi:hypothetical protein
MMKKYFLFIPVLLVLLTTSCKDEAPEAFLFASSIPEDYVFGKLENDTSVTFIVNTQDEWTATTDADWFTLSNTDGFEKTQVRMTIKRNLGERLRTAEILFTFKNSPEPKKLLIRQFGSAGEFVIDVNALELSSARKDTSVVVFCNMPLEKSIEYTDGNGWLTLGETQEVSPYKYKVKFATASDNAGTSIRRAKLILKAKNTQNTEFKKEIALSQMYYTLPVSYTFSNSDNFKITWNAVLDATVQYYALRAYDSNFQLVDSVNVTGLSEYNISDLPALNGTKPFLGEINLEIIGKENGNSVLLKAKTPKIATHSHFLAGNGSNAKPILLSCYRHLNNFRKILELYPETSKLTFQLNNDITLPDPVLTNGFGSNFMLQSSFAGVFDGNGFALKNVSIISDGLQVAPFTILSKTGIIKNLTIQVGFIKSTKAAVTAGIVGLHYGRIINCFTKPYNSSSVIFSDSPMLLNGVNGFVLDAYWGYAGGISGSLEGSIIGCGNHCPIVTAVNAGGISGGCQNTSSLNGEIVNCYNTATIYHGNPLGVSLPGGIVVTTTKIGTHAGVSVGGIVGYSSPMAEGVKIQRSFNSGNIYAASGNIGGICGRSFGLSIEDSYNTGTISCKKTSVTNVHIAGITAFQNGVFNKSYRTYNIGNLEYDQYTTLGMMFGQVGKLSNFDMVYADLGNGIKAIGKNNYPPTTVRPEDNPLIIKKLTLEQMQDLSNFWGIFKSNTYWVINTSNGYLYPQLQANPHK